MSAYDTAICETAGRQRDLITWSELVDAGVTGSGVWRRVRAGTLHRLHRGVYKVGTARVDEQQRCLAAALACGEGAVVSHGSAGKLLRVVKRAPEQIHVTFPRPWSLKLDGVVVHQCPTLHKVDRSHLEGIPVTPVPRILVDLAAELSLGDLARAFHEAHVRYKVTPAMVEAALARVPRRPGAPRLRAAMGTEHRLTLSVMEDGFVDVLRGAELLLPRTNIDYAGDKVDCHWPELGVTIELLSFRYHATRHAFEADVARRRRSGHLAFTYGDVFEHPAAMLRELTPILRP